MVSFVDFEGEHGEVIFGASDLIDQSVKGVPFEVFEVDDACVHLFVVGATAEEVALLTAEDGDFSCEELAFVELFAEHVEVFGAADLAEELADEFGGCEAAIWVLLDQAITDEVVDGAFEDLWVEGGVV